jgi:hypothetical protein
MATGDMLSRPCRRILVDLIPRQASRRTKASRPTQLATPRIGGGEAFTVLLDQCLGGNERHDGFRGHHDRHDRVKTTSLADSIGRHCRYPAEAPGHAPA